jgi:endo-1,4-beta-xylanase
VILEKQADAYRAMLKVCIEEPACKMFKCWGFLDDYGWKPERESSLKPKALIFDSEMNPKPAYQAMRQLLMEKLKNGS